MMQKQDTLKKDPHSYAEPDKVVITHLHLELTPNFENHQISGLAELTLNWLDTSANKLVLDTRKLDVQKIEVLNQEGSWNETHFKIDNEDAILGSALHIEANPENKKVKITYETSPEANGLQWLDASQTGSKEYPYLYSQSEPHLARSWIPLQDTPEVRQTYTTTINKPKALRAVMSAENDPDHPLNGKFEFCMPQKIPSYLIALALGSIEAKKIGPRSAVYSESTTINAAAKEFEDTEQMIQVTEQLYGSYRWNNYDLLVLPPSFPYGGMENPRLTFLTPTVIAGDKSMVSLVAHELAHSWSGNLVTNAAWCHVWLNEGFTTYVQNRIVEAVYGKEQADQEFITSINDLHEEFKTIDKNYQRLVPDLEGQDPDEGISSVVYTKGAWFLKTLEIHFGREEFDAFLHNYFDHFAFQSITTDQFESFLKEHLIDKYPGKYTMDQVNEWIHQPGIPKDAVQIRSEQLDINDVNRQKWLSGKINAAGLHAKQWSGAQWQFFFSRITSKLTHQQAKDLDDTYHLTGMGNHAIAARWYKIAIASEYSEANQALFKHLLTIGRRLLIIPLYEELLKTEAGKQFAMEVYQQARPTYHAIIRDTIEKKFTAALLDVSLLGEEQTQISKNKKVDLSTVPLNFFNFRPVNELDKNEQCNFLRYMIEH